MSRKSIPDPSVIFTYGTLRPGFGGPPEAHMFRSEARHIGPGMFQGKLYAIDWYPAAIDGDAPSDIVVGDLFAIGETPDFFDKLDHYEACSPAFAEPHEYKRVIRDVSYNGQLIPAWMYLFNWAVTDLRRIESGDFADYAALR